MIKVQHLNAVFNWIEGSSRHGDNAFEAFIKIVLVFNMLSILFKGC